MGVKSIGNPAANFRYRFGRTGKGAVGEPPPPISATGGTKTISGSYTIHTFTASGSLVVSSGSAKIEYLVVAGGGGGGSARGGGGGAGGFRTNISGHPLEPGNPGPGGITLGPGTYTVTVGGGGSGYSNPSFVTSGTLYSGSGATAGNNTDPLYSPSYAFGGAPNATPGPLSAGGNGAIIIVA